jgi:hypothetical protein
MAALPVIAVGTRATPRPITLLELVRAVSEVTSDEREIAATVIHMLRSGRVKLRGCLRDEKLEDLLR